MRYAPTVARLDVPALLRALVRRAMVVVFLLAVTAPLAIAGPDAVRATDSGSVAQATDVPPWLERLTLWLRMVREHSPGDDDMPARIVGSWSEAELEELRTDFFALVALQQRLRARRASVTYKEHHLNLSDVQEILGLSEDESVRGDATRILKRAALLHADVAMFIVPMSPSSIGCLARSTVLVEDGRSVGSGCAGTHWVQGRALLDAVKPDPRKDPMVRLWYYATIAHMLGQSDLADADPQIEHAAQLFPMDPGILFEHGYFHEAFSAPHVQPAAHASGADRRPASVHLKEAAEHYGRALEVNPDFVEARVHRGAVLGRLGRHEEAAAELRRAAPSAQGPILRYYAALFLGDEEQALGSRDAARACYNDAAALFPLAQAPRVALSHLARRHGDREGALRALRDVFTLPADERDRPDPWWKYYGWLNQNSDVLLRELYRPFPAGGSR
ncbi:MAG: hypothetical protein NTY02_04450 [Acidobacteria bacterium]|nr:hypothetical protein [Acidobacteriota bacterium]